MNTNPICCNDDAVWVENIPGKGYYYCRSCKNEVLTPIAVEEKPYDKYDLDSDLMDIIDQSAKNYFDDLDDQDLQDLTDMFDALSGDGSFRNDVKTYHIGGCI